MDGFAKMSTTCNLQLQMKISTQSHSTRKTCDQREEERNMLERFIYVRKVRDSSGVPTHLSLALFLVVLAF